MADFAALAQQVESWEERGAWLTLVHPYTQEPLGDPPARILLMSRLSKRWREMDRLWQVDRLISMQSRANDIQPDDLAKFEAHVVKCSIAVTREWENVERNGAPLTCSPVNIEWLYSLDWVRDQVLQFTADSTNFGGPEGTNAVVHANLLDDIEKKSSIGATGSSP